MKLIRSAALCCAILFSLELTVPIYAQVDQNGSSTNGQSATKIGSASRMQVAAIRKSQDIAVDGILDETAWSLAPAIDQFTQDEPNEGEAPSERTVVRVIYDDEAIYVGAKMYDASPDSIVKRLGRRDSNLDADQFGIFIDPYLDRRTGFYFGVNAAGTLLDGVLLNDDWDDDSWDGVWQGKARIDEDGWTVEMRIPYSQLRFHESDVYTWGINFRRDISRRNERIFLVHTPRNESGFVSRFANLSGIESIRPPRQIELTPYITTKAEFVESIDGDPFNDGSTITPDVGADLKLGVTSNLTLNATINPDFGQVEVDPAVVNLSDRETFFSEKRPFFIEGQTVFSFGRGGSNSNWGFNWSNPTFFHSRRIGRAPQGRAPGNDYVDIPDGTRILGAAKLTGKIGDTWNAGTVQAVTNSADAEYSLDGTIAKAEVEPLAYYNVTRAQREFNEGRQAIGFLATATARSFSNDELRNQINGSAYAFGLDGWTFLDQDKVWVLTGWAGSTHIRGTAERITSVQRSSQHYFQRPDFEYASVDSSATSLTGMAGRLALNKQSGNVRTNAAIGFITPSFDVNDLGFQFQTNVINAHIAGGYRWSEPKGIYRNAGYNASLFRTWDFDGNTTWTGIWNEGYITLKNYYNGFLGGAVNPKTISNRRTRGGPLMENRPGYEIFTGFSTDSRKKLVFSPGLFTYRSEAGNNAGFWGELEWKPAANVSLEIQPEYNYDNSVAQWVGAFDDPDFTPTFGRRYVFGEIQQRTVSSEVRLNWTFTPTLSLQLFAQPLIASGEYSNFKYLERAKSFDFVTFGEEGSTIDEETLVVDPDGPGPSPEIDLNDPDFNFKALRGTAVVRWEFRPGSRLFLVWTQSRDDFESDGRLRLGRSLDRLVSEKADNIFVVKFTYWLNR